MNLFMSLFTAIMILLTGIYPVSTLYAQHTETEHIVLDVRVHQLISESDDLHSKLSKNDIHEIFKDVNSIWKKAGIEWRIESIISEEAVNIDILNDAPMGPGRSQFLRHVMPTDHLTDNLWHVFFINNVGGAGGVYINQIPAIIQSETIPMRGSGSIEEISPILAHEFGHSLSLAHVPCPEEGNLMAGGCPHGERGNLMPLQIEIAREQALNGEPFKGHDFGAGPLLYLLAHADQLELSPSQTNQIQKLNETFIKRLEPVNEELQKMMEEMRQMGGIGNMSPQQRMERMSQSENIRELREKIESEIIDDLFSILNKNQLPTTEVLLERQKLIMGMEMVGVQLRAQSGNSQ